MARGGLQVVLGSTGPVEAGDPQTGCRSALWVTQNSTAQAASSLSTHCSGLDCMGPLAPVLFALVSFIVTSRTYTQFISSVRSSIDLVFIMGY